MLDVPELIGPLSIDRAVGLGRCVWALGNQSTGCRRSQWPRRRAVATSPPMLWPITNNGSGPRRVGQPDGGVGHEVGGVVALQGDAANPLGAAVGALVEGVDPEPGGGEPFGDVLVAAGVLAAAVEDRHDGPRLTLRRP